MSFLAQACLAVRGGTAACDRCAKACPVKVLAVGADGTALVGDCLRCGRCSASCPSGALVTQGFEEAQLPDGNLAVTIECWKVPRELTGKQALRVPCLAGIPLYRLVEWIIAAGKRPLVFIDRGWCALCLAGGAEFAATARLAALEPWLEACGLRPEQWPQCRSAPLPIELMPAEIPLADHEIVLGRRAFFGRLGRKIAHSDRPAALPAAARAALRHQPCALPAHQRWLKGLTTLAEKNGRTLPATALPQLVATPACRDHGLCASACPTGALRRETTGRQVRLVFQASTCVACRRCVDICPEGALNLEAGGSHEATVIHSDTLQSCLECGRDFVAAETETICPQCRHQRSLARSLFASCAGPDVAG